MIIIKPIFNKNLFVSWRLFWLILAIMCHTLLKRVKITNIKLLLYFNV